MEVLYFKEEVAYCNRLPAKIVHHRLMGAECFYPMHWHNEVELNLMLQGRGEFTVNGQKQLLVPGDFILINSQDIHMAQYPAQTPVEERFQELITIVLDLDFLRSYVDDVTQLRFAMPASKEKTGDIRGYIQRIGKHFIQGGPCHEMHIMADLLKVGAFLLCNYRVEKEELAGLKSSPTGLSEMQKAVAYIDAYFEEELTLEKISEHMGLSPNYFSRRFRQMTGVTFREYLCSQRLKYAARDLLSSDRSITEIAFKNGFPNVKSFIENFRKAYQITPEKYRRRMVREV